MLRINEKKQKAEYGTLVASVYNLINSNYFHFFVKKLFALDESNLVFIAEVAKKKTHTFPIMTIYSHSIQ